ncbi:MAG TPA: hypothetical protein VLI04_18230 [Nocardioidaceae bacterium]|nr:hypothetical protein [Nocardioidaceae bacterium]
MSRTFRGLAAALVSVALAATAAPALAKPPVKPGAVSNIQVTATKTGNVFDVSSTWTAGANATRYAVRLSSSGVTLDSGSVTSTNWLAHTTIADGSLVTVAVTSFNGRRRGPTVFKNYTLPDLTAPTGIFTVVRNNGTGGNIALHVEGLDDNTTPTNSIDVKVKWEADASPVNWPAPFSDLGNVYSEALAVHYVTVTLTDAADNSRDYPLTIVVNDTAAPHQGQFTVSTTSAWASYTPVSLTQVAVADNLSLANKLTRIVDWADGTAAQPWAQGAALAHKYAAAGTYTPVITLIDEAGNPADFDALSAVVVKVDSAAPVVAVKVPKARTSVKAWRTVRGKASDAGVGVRNVILKAIEKRGTAWYAYKAGKKTWVKVGTKAKALKAATAASVKPTALGAWSVVLAKLTKGTLVVKVRAFDRRGNASAWVTKKATLTRR